MSTSTTVSRRGFVAAAGTAAGNAVSDWGVEYPWPAGPPASRLTWRP